MKIRLPPEARITSHPPECRHESTLYRYLSGPDAEPNAPDPAHLLAEALDGFVYDFDVASGRVRRSGAVAALLGYPDDQVDPTSAWWSARIHPDDASLVAARLDEAYADPEATRFECEYRVQRKDGTYRWVHDRGRIVRDERRRVVRVLGVATPVDPARYGRRETLALDPDTLLDIAGSSASAADARAKLFEAERRMRTRAEQLQRLSAALSRNLGRREVADVIVQHLVDGLGAQAAGVVELNAESTEYIVLATIGLSPTVIQRFTRYPVTVSLPIRDIFRTHEPVFLRSRAEWVARYDLPPRMRSDSSDGSWVALPLLVDDRLLGAVTLTFPTSREFPDDDRAHMRAFADQCAQGLDRARAYEAESEARIRWERSARRLSALHAAATALGGALTPAKVADAVIRTALPALGAQRGSLALVSSDGKHLELTGATGYPREIVERFTRVPLDAPFPLTDVVRSGEALFLNADEDRRTRYPALASLIDENGVGGMAVVPLWRAGRVIGAIGINWDARRDFDAEEESFLDALAEQCAQAIERAQLFEGERRARSTSEMILSSIQDGFIALDHELRFTYVNRRAEELLRRTSNDLLGRVATDVFPQYARSPFANVLREALLSRRTRMVDGFVAPVGAWTEARIYPTDEGVSVFIQDVTDRRRVDESNRILATSSAILADASGVAATANAVVRAAIPDFADWAILDATTPERALQRLAMASRDPLHDAAIAAIDRDFPPDAWAPLFACTVHQTGVPRLFEEITRDALLAMMRGVPNAERHVDALLTLGIGSAICAPLTVRGEPIGVVTFVSADGHRRYTEEDLPLARELAARAASALDKARSFEAERDARAEAEEARREAEEANRAKMDFLTAMSHELRTPLNAIGGYAEILSMELRGPITCEQRQDLGRIQGSQRHLLGLINDVLNFAKLDAGKVEYTIVPVELRTEMSTVESLVAPQLESKALHFRYGTCDDEVRVLADPEKVRQILLNILSNAVKYTPPGGEIEVICAMDGRFGYLSIRDTGVGIESAKLERIFEPFVQLGRTLTSRTEGTGLGLAISRDLARAMGGELVAESEVGLGSTFTLRLPAA